MKNNNRTYATIAIISLLCVILCCASWCTSGMGIMGFITMAFAVSFTTFTYLASRPAKRESRPQRKAIPVNA